MNALEVFENIGVFAIASALILFVFKKIIEKYLDRIFEVKNRILELQRHKSQLRYTSLQKRQFEVISELYVDTIDLTDEVNEYITWLGFKGRTPEEKAEYFLDLIEK